MQVNWENLIAECYPRLDRRLFQRCLNEVQDHRRLSLEEFRYIVLGSGYYFEVHRPSADDVMERVDRAISGPYGESIIHLVVNEQRIRQRVEQDGWEVGPDRVRLRKRGKNRGRLPDPAPKIAALTVDEWIRHHMPGYDWTTFVRGVYEALSGRKVSAVTLGRMRKTADAVKTKRYLPLERELPVIADWRGMLENRYRQFRKREDEAKQRNWASVAMRLEKSDLGNLYPISDMAAPVLRAVGVETAPRIRGGGRFRGRDQKPLFV